MKPLTAAAIGLLVFASGLALADAVALVPANQQNQNGKSLNGAEQDPLLLKFLADHPEHPLHHWSAGEVWVNDVWVSHWDAISKQEGRFHEVYRYRQQRDQKQDNFRDNLFLADGCHAHKLYNEERAHLVRVLLHDYSFHEAHQRLGHVSVDRIWITPRELELGLREAQRTTINLKIWSEQVQQLHHRLSQTKPGSDAEEEVLFALQQIRTPDAIPALERFLASQGPRETVIYQDWLATIDSHEAAEALARQSIIHESAELRVRAADLLKERRYESYVPYLMTGLTTESTRYRMVIEPLLPSPFSPLVRRVSRQRVISTADSELVINEGISILRQVYDLGYATPSAPGTIPIDSPGIIRPRVQTRGPITAIEQVPQFQQFASTYFADVVLADYGQESLDKLQQVRTDRIRRTLTTTTDEEFKDEEECFEWWRKHNEIVLAAGKLQIQDSYDDGLWYVDSRQVQRVQRTIQPTGSCFVAGTPVETEHGSRPIEEIQVGDCVLAQDVETGELAFRPVFDRPKREDAPTVIIKAGSDELQCSLGHPFWISGHGWRMAKELEPGMLLTTLNGTQVKIDEIVPQMEQTVYNLIVADFNTYFAGKQRFLTHDVTSRVSTDMALPGIRREFQ